MTTDASWSVQLRTAHAHASAGRFAECLDVCDALVHRHAADIEVLLSVGALLLNTGHLERAEQCFQRVAQARPDDSRAAVNLANVAREAGRHRAARQLYAELLQRYPDHPVVRRNALVSLEYDHAATDAERLGLAKAWGVWAVRLAGGARDRPARRPRANRPLRLGYVSADVCQHTVGLFIRDVLTRHDPGRVRPYVYSAGPVNDWVTAAVSRATEFRDVSRIDDVTLADTIRQDEIDVLVDLSGHTAGSRLTAFAHRPAPVQASWLGYFATTGLDCMDAVLLDDWHAPPGTEEHFVERLVRLPYGRLCYTPVPWAPAVQEPPFAKHGHVTFGSFNNSAKLNDEVLATWAEVLRGVERSRLVLKWRTFNDLAFRRTVLEKLQAWGIDPGRVELRGPSFHAEALKQYADIDIALDPFPFTGGLTTCEALWMGLPVVTWPQTRVVSRQSFALLSAIGLPEFAARDRDGYVRIAHDLAKDGARLLDLRRTLRDRMRSSPLMDVARFTRALEEALAGL